MQAVAADCVTIAVPSPMLRFTYQHTQSAGAGTRRTEQWESVTAAGSRVRVTRQGATEISVNEHHIADEVAVVDRNRKLAAGGGLIDSTSFTPGMVLDPVFRACSGRTWPIPPVTASYRSSRQQASAATAAGELRILAIHEQLSTPAGRFDTVHYVRTTQSRDEYWKSIEHGVVVKHLATLPRFVVSDVLVKIE
jgi:hypothetical protein